MSTYLLRRVVSLLPTTLIVATIVFMLMHLTPGDPAAAMLGVEALPEDIARVRHELGLDSPLHVQLLRWYMRLLRGDFGNSVFLGGTVVSEIVARLEPTFLLTVLGTLVAVGLGVPLGVLSAVRVGSWIDQTLMFVAVLGVSIPGFWLALNLILVFAVSLRWLPPNGYVPLRHGVVASLRYLTLPAASLGFVQSALIARITRASVLEVLREDYVRTARAKGLAERAVVYKHALKNAMVSIITVIGLTFATLIGGVVVIETVFNIPGIGRLIMSSVLRRDYPVVQGVIFFIAGTYVLINLLVDLSYLLCDPRVKY